MSALVEASAVGIAGRLEPTCLALEAGLLTCLIGPNGSGKTSLLHGLAGVGNPAGEVLVDGVSVRTALPGARQRLVSYLPASREVMWPLAARDLIRLGSPDPLYLPLVMDALELAPLADRRADRMSTGERSRALIARALAPRARLLLLDEPAANLDPLWQLRLMDLLGREARANRQAALVAMHDLELAARYADRLLILDKGRILADGDPEALLAGPEIPRVFGIERGEGGWRPVIRPADPRSSP